MIHAVCDMCGKDCNHNAYFVEISPFSNFARYHHDHTTLGTIDGHATIVLCEYCLKKRTGLPNPYNLENEQVEDVRYESMLEEGGEDGREEDGKDV